MKTVKYSAEFLENGDTLKQLLARSRYLLYKSSGKWTKSQSNRAETLFQKYPDLEKGYKLCQNLSAIFNNTINKTLALIRLAKWNKKVIQAKFKRFNTIARTISIYYKNILNYFDNRSTNASAESFNEKLTFLEHSLEVSKMQIFSCLELQQFLLKCEIPQIYDLISFRYMIFLCFQTKKDFT